jgi:hypothetical protein
MAYISGLLSIYGTDSIVDIATTAVMAVEGDIINGIKVDTTN